MTARVVSYGAGTNSTALLVGLVNRGEPAPHAILFADTGGEHPATYAYLALFSDWLRNRGYPRVTVVWRVDRDGWRLTLEADCLRKRMLPSVAYGYKSCSQKYKVQPQDKWCNNDPVLRTEWAAGRTVVKVIGFDADEPHRARIHSDAKYEYRYPLVEWGWAGTSASRRSRRPGCRNRASRRASSARTCVSKKSVTSDAPSRRSSRGPWRWSRTRS